MKQFYFLFTFSLFVLTFNAYSQNFTLEAYIDSYASIDNDQLGYHMEGLDYFRLFSTVNGRENELGLNIAQLSATVDDEHYYGALTLQYGDIPQQAWGGSAPVIQEAYAGIKLNKRISIDAGYFTTHIGGELLLPKDNYLSSHSMATFLEPFYHAGIRSNFQITDKFSASLSILNGMWVFQDDNENKTLGLSLIYESEKYHIKYSGAYGNEQPGAPELALFETYNDLSVEFHALEKLSLKGQIDFHLLETVEDSDTDYRTIIAFAAEGKYQFAKKWSSALRLAYITNEDGLDSHAPSTSGLGLTAGFEFTPYENSYVRLEGRYLQFDEGDNLQGNIFSNGDELTNSRMELMLNFGVYFDLLSKK